MIMLLLFVLFRTTVSLAPGKVLPAQLAPAEMVAVELMAVAAFAMVSKKAEFIPNVASVAFFSATSVMGSPLNVFPEPCAATAPTTTSTAWLRVPVEPVLAVLDVPNELLDRSTAVMPLYSTIIRVALEGPLRFQVTVPLRELAPML